MKRVGIVAFSEKGGQLALRLQDAFRKENWQAEGFLFRRYEKAGLLPFDDLSSLTGSLFARTDFLIFVGACGIAVRAVAPFLRSKMTDPGVLAVDECGVYVVSLLSGHVGGANALAEKTARLLGAEPVITTATDRGGIFAADTWAVQNGLRILYPERIKQISARLLAGEPVGFDTDFPIDGRLAPGLTSGDAESGIVVCYPGCEKESRFPVTCVLHPTDLVAGMGCRKGISFSALQAFLLSVLDEYGLAAARIGKLCSISRKSREPGLAELAAWLQVPFATYPAARLNAAVGSFAASAFVEQRTGTDNVCERSACLGSGNGEKIIGKQVRDGMTLAVYRREVRLRFP